MSIADSTTPQKIVESFQQIICTNKFERSMEFQIYSQVENFVFHANDDTLVSVLEYMVKDALNSLEKRASVNDVVTTRVDLPDGSSMVAFAVNFTVLATNKTYNTLLGTVSEGGVK